MSRRYDHYGKQGYFPDIGRFLRSRRCMPHDPAPSQIHVSAGSRTCPQAIQFLRLSITPPDGARTGVDWIQVAIATIDRENHN
jgi:hypothetical protein